MKVTGRFAALDTDGSDWQIIPLSFLTASTAKRLLNWQLEFEISRCCRNRVYLMSFILVLTCSLASGDDARGCHLEFNFTTDFVVCASI